MKIEVEKKMLKLTIMHYYMIELELTLIKTAIWISSYLQ